MNPTTYYEAPDEYLGPGPAIFLAGGITGCPDWQQTARQWIDGRAVILNPRRANFPIDDPQAGPEQIRWEQTHRDRATVILFWFPDSGPIPQPIALLELGDHARGGTRIAVGAHDRYIRRVDVEMHLAHRRPEVHLWRTLEDTITEAVRLVSAACPF